VTTWVIIGAVVLLGLYLIITYNGMVKARNRVDETWSGIAVQLKRRHDLIPNLVETVKGYAAHERGTFEAVTKARTAAMQAQTDGPAAVAVAEAGLNSALGRLWGIAEAYPDLKASETFIELQRELTNTEDRISSARQIYNGNVQSYNTKIQTVPASFVAGPFGFTPREYFEIEDPADREAVKVSFS
jgi:LemA protein